jgi:hypothetical protein
MVGPHRSLAPILPSQDAMRRVPVTTLLWLALFTGLVGTLVAFAIRRAGSRDTPIGNQVNDLIATFEIPLQAAPGTFHAIPGWATLALLVAAAAALASWRLRAQRARSNRS